MANMRAVNKAIKDKFPKLTIEAVAGGSYVYFDGFHGFDKLDSIMTNPRTTKTEDLIRICLEDIAHYYKIEG